MVVANSTDMTPKIAANTERSRQLGVLDDLEWIWQLERIDMTNTCSEVCRLRIRPRLIVYEALESGSIRHLLRRRFNQLFKACEWQYLRNLINRVNRLTL